jgi:hypothetical protein
MAEQTGVPYNVSCDKEYMMDAPRTSFDTAIDAGIIVLTIGTAVTHMSLLFPDVMFLLNGIGYLALLGALYLPIPRLMPYRRLIRRALIGYAILTIVLWIAIGERSTIGYLNKLNETALVALLLLRDRRAAMRA